MPQLRLDRRTLLKVAAAIAGGGSLEALLGQSIARAAAIDPEPGSTFVDAEHVVFLMQENRSFDHCYGSLQGVRGFNDPRAIDLPNGRPVWLQADAQGDVYAPFRLDMLGTNVTWHNGLPHDWPDQVDARNHGKYDRWLEVKRPGKKLAHLPALCLGYHTRADLPFYYRLADAFTVCDQHFCSTLTGTNPNRLHFWSGTIRAQQRSEAKPHVFNSDEDYGTLSWTTYPERLSAAGISWRVYQNEVGVASGLTEEEDRWVGNFGDNGLEYFAQYRPHLSPCHTAYLQKAVAALPDIIAKLETAVASKPNDVPLASQLIQARNSYKHALLASKQWTPEALAQLPAHERALHEQGLTTNRGLPEYREIVTVTAETPEGKKIPVTLPKGDVLHRFRQDVQQGKLPAVSWLVAPQAFSDHPSSAWFGAWYVSEILNILTQNPEVWKKTIFVLNYDENDGYFDHVPPFVAPVAGRAETGACSEGVDSTLETTTRMRASPIGLGYRVPLIVASPWSRGGWVNSQVFDLTSPIRFLETFFERKLGKRIAEPQITSWRRTITGDMTSIFRPWEGKPVALPEFVKREAWVDAINAAYYQPAPERVPPLTPAEIDEARRAPRSSQHMPRQEPGTRPSCALPYELRVDAGLSQDRRALLVDFAAGAELFGAASAGAPFQVYAPGKVRAAAPDRDGTPRWDNVRVWNYAVAAGKTLQAEFPLADFENDRYFLRVYGPNGFYRELLGTAADPLLAVRVETELLQGKATGNLLITLTDLGQKSPLVKLMANAYDHPAQTKAATVAGALISLPLKPSSGWYDFTLSVAEAPSYARRYAGRIETGVASISDPVMGAE
jgi:phospholipase C